MLEGLEERRLLSVAIAELTQVPALDLATGELHVTGTGQADRIVLRQHGRRVIVRVNNVVSRFAMASITQITVDAYAGNDRISARGVRRPLRIDGDLGEDTIIGGRRNDTLLGGSGNDRLLPTAGDDFLNGQDGNDILIGGSGNDFLEDLSGNNRLDGCGGSDTLNGGAGNDTLNGGIGPDVLADVGGVNRLRGGPGYDQAQMLEDSGRAQQIEDLVFFREPPQVLPSEFITLSILQDDQGGYFVRSRIDFPSPHYQVGYGPVQRQKKQLYADLSVQQVFASPPTVIETHTDDLLIGSLSRGSYAFTLRTAGIVVARIEFTVS